MAFHPDHVESISFEEISQLSVILRLELTGVKSYQCLNFVSEFISDGWKRTLQKCKKLL